MLVIKIAHLKSRLSYFLKLVRKGETILVKDREEPVAELVPYRGGSLSERERLVKEGKIIPATVTFNTEVTPLKKPVSVKDLLDFVRGE